VESVENLSTIFVDKSLEDSYFVDIVEKLSPLFVDNWLTSVILWKRWKTCPQYLWITFQRVMNMWKVWITCPHFVWINDRCGSAVESVDKLSTQSVDNFLGGMLLVERVENLSITTVDTSKEVIDVKRKRVIHKQCG
jgi:hypothetical protein